MTADTPALGGRMGAGAANTPLPGQSATTSGNDGSDALIASIVKCLLDAVTPAMDRYQLAADRDRLAMCVVPDEMSPPTIRPLTYGEIADAVIAAGYRLVSEDEATVDRVARAMFADYHHWGTWDQADEGTRERFAGFARSAVRALREAGE